MDRAQANYDAMTDPRYELPDEFEDYEDEDEYDGNEYYDTYYDDREDW
jgi:hypothetical protein